MKCIIDTFVLIFVVCAALKFAYDLYDIFKLIRKERELSKPLFIRGITDDWKNEMGEIITYPLNSRLETIIVEYYGGSLRWVRDKKHNHMVYEIEEEEGMLSFVFVDFICTRVYYTVDYV